MKKIIVVDDEKDFSERLAKAFNRRGFVAFSAGSYDEAMEIIRLESPDAGVFDLKMPGKSGLDLLKTVKEEFPAIEVVVLTGYGSIATAVEAVKIGALSYISKPADVDDILTAFNKSENLDTTSEKEELSAPSLARMEWEHISRVLQDCDNNISMAARRLGLHRRTLQRKLQKYPPKK